MESALELTAHKFLTAAEKTIAVATTVQLI